MKLFCSVLILLIFVACSKRNVDTPASAGNNGANDKTNSGFLTLSEESTMINTPWCQSEASVALSFTDGSITRHCNVEVTLRHNISKFTDTEFYTELSYFGKRVRCVPAWGNTRIFSQDEINDALKDDSYRISLIDINRALTTRVGEGQPSREVDLRVMNGALNITPIDKSLKPVALVPCSTL